VDEVKMISWRGTRKQRLLVQLWYQSEHDRNALQAAKIFGDARRKVAGESRSWKGSELALALKRIIAAEKLVKGASIEDRPLVIERLTLDLVAEGRLSS